MFKTLIVAIGLVLAGLSFAPKAANAATFGNQSDIATSAAPNVEKAQFYGPRRGYYRPRYVRPRYYGPRYYRPRYYAPRPRFYGPRPYYGPRRFYYGY